MGKTTTIPFGPQHPVLPEPIHLTLELQDEIVVGATPRIGYIHRGLEKLVEKRDYVDYVLVAERICGICSFIHGYTYCHGVETLMGIQAPPRAEYLRVIWSELSRIHSHLLWAGLYADAIGFESLFMQTWRLRELVLDIIEETTGGRVIFGSCKVGGVRRDVGNDKLKEILKKLEDMNKDFVSFVKIFREDSTIKHRTCGIGVMSAEDAWDLGAVGPTLRGSGVASDMRTLGYAAYKDLRFEPIVETAGDSYARCLVRMREIVQSVDIIREAVGKIPDGPVDQKVTGTPTGEFYARVEQPRGEVVYYFKGNGTRNLERLRVRTPTFSNIPAIVRMLAGCHFADVPVLIMTMDPCISCTER